MKEKLKALIIKPIEEKKEKMTDLKQQLLEFLGIGAVKADELIEAGLKNIKQLKMKKWMDMLPDVTQKILKYKPERQIPHEKIKIIEDSVISLVNEAKIILVGSYRRKTSFSRDIDVMIVSNDVKVLDTFLENAKKTFDEENVILYANGPDKLSMLVRFNNVKNLKAHKLGIYKLDVFRCPKDQEAAMLLYSTGSKNHNILMRQKAKSMKMLLNQKGLFLAGKLLPAKTEKDIFNHLEMDYKEPLERN